MDLSKQIEDCKCGNCADCTIAELRKENFILREQIIEARDEAVQKFLHASPGWLALEKAKDRYMKANQELLKQVQELRGMIEAYRQNLQ